MREKTLKKSSLLSGLPECLLKVCLFVVVFTVNIHILYIHFMFIKTYVLECIITKEILESAK